MARTEVTRGAVAMVPRVRGGWNRLAAPVAPPSGVRPLAAAAREVPGVSGTSGVVEIDIELADAI